MIVWTGDILDRLKELVAEKLSARDIASRLSTEWGIQVTRRMVLGAADRAGLSVGLQAPKMAWTSKRIAQVRELAAAGFGMTEIARRLAMSGPAPCSFNAVKNLCRREGIKAGDGRKNALTRKKRKTAKAPSLVPALATIRRQAPELVPTGRTPVTFLAAGDFVCKLFLPGEPVAAHGLVCGNPIEPGSALRFCPACKVRLCDGKPSAPALNDKTLFMFPRKRQRARAA